MPPSAWWPFFFLEITFKPDKNDEKIFGIFTLSLERSHYFQHFRRRWKLRGNTGVNVNNPLAISDLKAAITAAIRAIPREECLRVNENFPRRIQVCLQRQGAHFEHIFEGQCLLHWPGFQHLIAAAPAAVVLFSCSIYYLSAGIAAPNPNSKNGIAALTLTLRMASLP